MEQALLASPQLSVRRLRVAEDAVRTEGLEYSTRAL